MEKTHLIEKIEDVSTKLREGLADVRTEFLDRVQQLRAQEDAERVESLRSAIDSKQSVYEDNNEQTW